MVYRVQESIKNNAYKTPGTSGTIDVSNKGGAFPIPTNKFTIVPVKLAFQQEEPGKVFLTDITYLQYRGGQTAYFINHVLKMWQHVKLLRMNFQQV